MRQTTRHRSPRKRVDVLPAQTGEIFEQGALFGKPLTVTGAELAAEQTTLARRREAACSALRAVRA